MEQHPGSNELVADERMVLYDRADLRPTSFLPVNIVKSRPRPKEGVPY